jgi:hypothetical protein
MRLSLRAIPVALLLASLSALLLPRGAQPVPLYAARTGLMCQSCHFDPNGGGPRNEFGFAFARNRHALEPEGEESPWHDLNLSNRVGDNVPIYFGVNQRFMVLANSTVSSDSLDRFGFYNMENALHVAFQPHPRLTLVYTTDGFATSGRANETSREAYGMIGGLPFDSYLRVGRFRVPFGLRLDDHTVATRNGYLDFGSQRSFLPFDPRFPDMGLEIGQVHGNWFGRASYTNGRANVLSGGFSETKAFKLGYNMSHAQSGISIYDDYAKERPPTLPTVKRATRWGYYGLSHWGRFAALGEVAAGTDEAQPAVPGRVSGIKTNLLAWFAELDYAPTRATNLRVRSDALIGDRSPIKAVREAATSYRYALEGEWVPVPFAELRWAVRHIDYSRDQVLGPVRVRSENQTFVQVHFSY